jgi:L-serine deaminase/ABC-type lipopolysaccharide export system ATPase subunit
VKIEMHFLPDVYVPCEVCKGKRYNRETLEVRFRGQSIADVLEMTVEDALAFFENQPRVRQKLETLNDVGLGYIHLGQSATTLSGGEAQRIKLATELSKRDTGRTFYILDEPTTGLHFEDVRVLLHVLHRLVDRGNTVLVIEHNLDVIKTADWIVDLGPEGGTRGGTIVAAGTPEDVARVDASHTGQYLRGMLEPPTRRRKAGSRGLAARHHRPGHGRPVVVAHGGRLSARSPRAQSGRGHSGPRAHRAARLVRAHRRGTRHRQGDRRRLDGLPPRRRAPARRARDRAGGGLRLTSFEKTTLDDDAHPNTARITVERGDRQAVMTGASLGAGRILVTEINGYAVEVSGAYHTIVLIAEDVKGSIAAIATILAEHGINIANLRLDAETARRRRVHGHRGRRRAGRARARRDSRLALGALGASGSTRSAADVSRPRRRDPRAEQQGISLARLALETEAKDQGRTVDDIRAALRRALDVMRGAVERGMVGDLHSASGSSEATRPSCARPRLDRSPARPFRDVLGARARRAGGERRDGRHRRRAHRGRAGVLPAVLTGLAQAQTIADDAVVDALAVAGLIGAVIAERASLSGAEGGCQAETGAAAAMAAGAATEMLGAHPRRSGTPRRSPCRARSASCAIRWAGSSSSPASFATPPGRRSRSPASSSRWPGRVQDPRRRGHRRHGRDRRVDGRSLPRDGRGGLAATPTGRRLARERLVQIKKR